MTGSSSRMSRGFLVRSWREASSTIAPTQANASSREAKRGAWYCGAVRSLSR
jgi:hypothetical protein